MKNAVYQFLLNFLIDSNALRVDLSFKEITLVYKAVENFPAEITGHHTIVSVGELTREH